jgi:Na+-transporting NADH:ubiquinone oxidoreductase subunit NqrA
MYSYVQSVIDGLSIGELTTIPIPDKLKAFRKFLSEIASKDHKKFTTKIKGGELHIMRIKYYSVVEKLESNG